jgi:hypothetical protein
MRKLFPFAILVASASVLGCEYGPEAVSSFDEAAGAQEALDEGSPELGLEAEAQPLSGSTSSYYVVYGKPNATLQLCNTAGCTSEAFYMRYNEDDNEFSIISRHGSTFNDRLVIERQNGNVGIGTNSPQQKLDVNGTVRAKRIIVENTTADYVFEEGYKLRSLNDVEAFIKKEGHLPEIPNAAYVKEHGSDLAKTQTLLLQKLEELTLYTIEQQKAIAKLQSKLAAAEE